MIDGHSSARLPLVISGAVPHRSALIQTADGWQLVGVNTFTEGYGGRFGDIGGGVLVEPYSEWIISTTGIPEPGIGILLALGLLAGGALRRRKPGRS